MSTPFSINSNELTLEDAAYPEVLRHIAAPPKVLYTAGAPLDTLLSRSRVAIVGSRKVSAYGREATTKLARSLAEQGIVVISGLALGVDALAHQAAVEAGGLTIAVLPGPLEKIYPASHTALAKRIIESGGALVSEYPAGTDIFRTNFIARNRLIAGLCDALLITEAAEKSGSLHTARFALEQGREVLAVPGSIFSPTSVGTNSLIKAGAMPATTYEDILHVLGLEAGEVHTVQGRTTEEQILLDLLAGGIRDSDLLLAASELDIVLFNQTLTMLELTGKVRSLGANQWTIN